MKSILIMKEQFFQTYLEDNVNYLLGKNFKIMH